MIILDGKKEEDLIKCQAIIKHGGIIVYPTDTVYGLGCDPYNKKSVEKIFRIKNRIIKKALPILTFDIRHVEKIMFLGESGRKLARFFLAWTFNNNRNFKRFEYSTIDYCRSTNSRYENSR